MDKPFIPICLTCEKEFPAVAQQVNTHRNNINFSHGYCFRHWIVSALQIPNISTKKLFDVIDKIRAKGNNVPDLRDYPQLVQAYSQGNFDQQPQQNNPPTSPIKERFQKLANIIKDI